jgi:hypothetical protein
MARNCRASMKIEAFFVSARQNRIYLSNALQKQKIRGLPFGSPLQFLDGLQGPPRRAARDHKRSVSEVQ